MKNQLDNHKQEILQSRTGGFGGSDSKLFSKIGRYYEYNKITDLNFLSYSDKYRILVARGEKKPQEINETIYMSAGRCFENAIEKSLQNTHLKENLLEKKIAKNFRTFAHADFYNRNIDEVVECKFTKSTIAETLMTYNSQLQWYFLLGVKNVILFNGHGDAQTMVDKGEYDYIEKYEVKKDNRELYFLQKGVEILDKFYHSEIELRENAMVEDLGIYDQQLALNFANALREIKDLEEKSKSLKEELKAIFELYNIKSLKSNSYVISYVNESIRTTIDNKKLQMEHPEINFEEYSKNSKVASSLRIKLL